MGEKFDYSHGQRNNLARHLQTQLKRRFDYICDRFQLRVTYHGNSLQTSGRYCEFEIHHCGLFCKTVFY